MSGRPARVRGRQAFAELGRSRGRAVSGAVRVHFVPADEVNPGFRVAYSVSRKVGSAVVRNRWRRRLRAVAAGVADDLPVGAYLVVLGPEINRLSFGDLQERVVQTMRRASELRP